MTGGPVVHGHGSSKYLLVFLKLVIGIFFLKNFLFDLIFGHFINFSFLRVFLSIFDQTLTAHFLKTDDARINQFLLLKQLTLNECNILKILYIIPHIYQNIF